MANDVSVKCHPGNTNHIDFCTVLVTHTHTHTDTHARTHSRKKQCQLWECMVLKHKLIAMKAGEKENYKSIKSWKNPHRTKLVKIVLLSFFNFLFFCGGGRQYDEWQTVLICWKENYSQTADQGSATCGSGATCSSNNQKITNILFIFITLVL